MDNSYQNLTSLCFLLTIQTTQKQQWPMVSGCVTSICQHGKLIGSHGMAVIATWTDKHKKVVGFLFYFSVELKIQVGGNFSVQGCLRYAAKSFFDLRCKKIIGNLTARKANYFQEFKISFLCLVQTIVLFIWHFFITFSLLKYPWMVKWQGFRSIKEENSRWQRCKGKVMEGR